MTRYYNKTTYGAGGVVSDVIGGVVVVVGAIIHKFQQQKNKIKTYTTWSKKNERESAKPKWRSGLPNTFTTYSFFPLGFSRYPCHHQTLIVTCCLLLCLAQSISPALKKNFETVHIHSASDSQFLSLTPLTLMGALNCHPAQLLV